MQASDRDSLSRWADFVAPQIAIATAVQASIVPARGLIAFARSCFGLWLQWGNDAGQKFRAGFQMARYVARFTKNVLGANGHEAEICQSLIEIEASNPEDATELAKVRFCQTERVGNWLLHADRVHVADVEIRP